MTLIPTLLLALFVAAPPPAAIQAADASGRWNTIVNAPDGPHTPVLTLKKDGDTLTGTISEGGNDLQVTGTQKGTDVSVSFTYPSGDGPIAITLAGVLKGDAIEGSATFGTEPGTWSAKRATAAPGAPATAAAAAIDVTGAWAFDVTTAAGAGTPTVTFKQTGDTLTGQYSGQLGEASLQGTLKGGEIAFGFELTVQDTKLRVLYTGTASKDSMKGKVVLGELGEGTFTGHRK